MWLLYILVPFWTLAATVWAIDRLKNIPADIKEKRRLDDLADEIKQREAALEELSKEKALGFPWLATAYSDYLKLRELKRADALERKRPPARRAAEEIREIAAEKAALRRENRILRELHRYYESLFPWLIDFKGEDVDEMIRQVNEPSSEEELDEDPAARWLATAEWKSQELTTPEKYQRALDRYWRSKKSPWQIERDYERYIGFLYDRKGFKVEYHGIEFGYEDLGRDLICSRGQEVHIVQCKYWSAQKKLHEKHVCQIFGTATEYGRRIGEQNDLFGEAEVTPWLYVSCDASPKAKDFADVLGVNLIDNFKMDRYPVIMLCRNCCRGGSTWISARLSLARDTLGGTMSAGTHPLRATERTLINVSGSSHRRLIRRTL